MNDSTMDYCMISKKWTVSRTINGRLYPIGSYTRISAAMAALYP